MRASLVVKIIQELSPNNPNLNYDNAQDYIQEFINEEKAKGNTELAEEAYNAYQGNPVDYYRLNRGCKYNYFVPSEYNPNYKESEE